MGKPCPAAQCPPPSLPQVPGGECRCSLVKASAFGPVFSWVGLLPWACLQRAQRCSPELQEDLRWGLGAVSPQPLLQGKVLSTAELGGREKDALSSGPCLGGSDGAEPLVELLLTLLYPLSLLRTTWGLLWT